MSRRLVGAAGRGVVKTVLSPEQQALLAEGDIEGLLEFHRAQFGSAKMEDEGDEDDEDEGDEGDAKGKRKKQDPKDVKIQELTAEAKKHRLKAREHRTAREQLEAENAELKRKLSKATKGKDSSDDDEDGEDDAPPARVQELERTNEDLLIRLEFMANNKHEWKNPKAALKLLDLSDVEIEDGEVVGLEDAIDQLAKDEPYLLKEAKGEPKQRRRGPSGQPTGTKRKGNPNRDKLLSKYPALRR